MERGGFLLCFEIDVALFGLWVRFTSHAPRLDWCQSGLSGWNNSCMCFAGLEWLLILIKKDTYETVVASDIQLLRWWWLRCWSGFWDLNMNVLSNVISSILSKLTWWVYSIHWYTTCLIYCWWLNSCTIPWVVYPSLYRSSYIPRGCRMCLTSWKTICSSDFRVIALLQMLLSKWRLSQWFRVRVILCSCCQDHCPYWLFVCSHCCCGEFLRLLAAIWKAGMALIVHDHPVGTCLLHYEGTLRSSGRINGVGKGNTAVAVGNGWVLLLNRTKPYEDVWLAMFIEVVSERLVIFWRSKFVVTFAINTNQVLDDFRCLHLDSPAFA